MEIIKQSIGKFYDLTGDMSSKFKSFKKRDWIINDVNYELTDEQDNDLRNQKIDEYEQIKRALESSNIIDVINDYKNIFTGKNGPWICHKLNIKLDTKTIQPKKTKLFDLPDNFEVVHNTEYNITDYDMIYFVNLDSMKLSQVLKLMENFKKIQIKFVITSKKYDIFDLLKYFDVIRSTHTEKGYTILI